MDKIATLGALSLASFIAMVTSSLAAPINATWNAQTNSSGDWESENWLFSDPSIIGEIPHGNYDVYIDRNLKIDSFVRLNTNKIVENITVDPGDSLAVEGGVTLTANNFTVLETGLVTLSGTINAKQTTLGGFTFRRGHLISDEILINGVPSPSSDGIRGIGTITANSLIIRDEAPISIDLQIDATVDSIIGGGPDLFLFRWDIDSTKFSLRGQLYETEVNNRGLFAASRIAHSDIISTGDFARWDAFEDSIFKIGDPLGGEFKEYDFQVHNASVEVTGQPLSGSLAPSFSKEIVAVNGDLILNNVYTDVLVLDHNSQLSAVNHGNIGVGGRNFDKTLKVLDGGLLRSSGVVDTDIVIEGGSVGTWAVGDSFRAEQNFWMTGGTLDVMLVGLAHGNFDFFDIDGSAFFDGGLIRFHFSDGYFAKPGDRFRFLEAASLDFNMVEFDVLGAPFGRSGFNIEQVGKGLELVALPRVAVIAPGTIWHVIIGIVGVVFWTHSYLKKSRCRRISESAY